MKTQATRSIKDDCEVMIYTTIILFVLGFVSIAGAATKDYAPFQLMVSDVEQAVGQSLAATELSDHVKATITSTRDQILHADTKPADVSIHTLTYDETNATWSANMVVSRQDEVVVAKPISGRYSTQIELPVLNRRVKNGDIITHDDVEYALFDARKSRHATVTDSEQLIGKTPRRTVSPERPIRANELEAPAVVKNGDVVQMQYKTAAMSISTIGEVLENGGIGDYVRVRNHDSSNVIRAKVASAREVIVGSHAIH